MRNTEESNSRPPIPDPMQREIRQRCGFGCVICGFPLFDYEHIEGYANVQRHVAEEITLLCSQHHREKTGGLLPVEKVREANKNPYNLRAGVSKPYDFHYSGSDCEITIGSNTFTTTDQGYGTISVPLTIDGVPILGFILSEGHLLLNLNLFDEFNNHILRIRNNQLLYSVSPWDIQLVGRNLVIREARGKILVDIVFEVPNKIVINRGRFLLNGVEVFITPDRVLITNNPINFSGGKAVNVPFGLVLGINGEDKRPSILQLENIPRYKGNHKEAMKWIRESFKDVKKSEKTAGV